jgi:Tfp pilus assembly pilus retraction ATPase PilT
MSMEISPLTGLRESSRFDLGVALADGVRRECTDLHLAAGDHPVYRLNGKLLRGYPRHCPSSRRRLAARAH